MLNHPLCIFILLLFIHIGLPDTAIGAEFVNRVKRDKDIFEPHKTDCGGHIGIVGEIKRNDTQKLVAIISKLRNSCDKVGTINIGFNSEGGDVDEAMKLGRYIRENAFITSLHENSVCYSACVLVLVSGVSRSVLGKVGVHRPYFSSLNSNETIVNIQLLRRKMTNDIREYLDFMDINTSLIDLMMATAPENMKILSFDEIDYYRIHGDDPSHEEKQLAERAEMYGTTSAIMRKRDINAQRCSQGSNIDWDCYKAAMWGLSLPIYKQRYSQFQERCKSFAIANNADGYVKCMKQTMLGK